MNEIEAAPTPPSPPDNAAEIIAASNPPAPVDFTEFGLAAPELAPASPAAVMAEDSRIAPYLAGGAFRKRGDWLKSAVASLLAVAALAAIAVWGNWEFFKTYGVTPVREQGTARIFTSGAPERYRAFVERINAQILEARRQTALDGMRVLLQDLAGDEADDAVPLRRWLLTEMLVLADFPELQVALAEGEEWFGNLVELAQSDGAVVPPYRAMEHYAYLLARHRPGDYQPLLALLNGVRAEYSRQLDANPVLLKLEAENHLAAMPVWLEGGSARAEHWRGADRAVAALRRWLGAEAPDYLRLEAMRWSRLLQCFYPLQKEISIDSATFQKEQVEQLTAQYREAFDKVKARPAEAQ